MELSRFIFESRVTGKRVAYMNSGALCFCRGSRRAFLGPAALLKQDKGCRKHTDSALAQKLPQFLVCTPFCHQRMAALGADGQAQPWCLAAQAFLHGVGRTTVVEEGLIYARPVNARHRSCVPKQCRNTTISVILACVSVPADRQLAKLSVPCTLKVLLGSW